VTDDLGEVLVRLAIDGVALAALVYGIYLRRHRRMDLAVVYAMFNVGLFIAVIVITRGHVTLGVGLGLFAVLSMVRLRSETYSNRELGYFFVALVLALVMAVDTGSLLLSAVLAAAALAAVWAIDHPRLSRPTRRLEVTLELVFKDQQALQRHLEERLNATILDVWILEVDYVRETTRAAVRYIPDPQTKPVSEQTLDAVARR
jgi:Domain of unknown function (DUF4956)